MNFFIDIIESKITKDHEGFSQTEDNTLASVRAYKEERHGTEKWANMAAFSNASALFRFRKIPGTDINPSLCIACGGDRYRIISADNVRGRDMYIEVLAEKLEPVVR